MKKMVLQFIAVLSLVFLSGCGSRIPFVEKKVSNENALVYIYVSNNIGIEENIVDDIFNIKINDKAYKQKIKMGEYLPFEMKPSSTKFSIIRASIEEKSLTLKLEASKIYYLRVDTNLDNGEFSFTNVSNLVASKEIVDMGLAGSNKVEESSILTEVIEPKKEEKVVEKSKSDEIRDAYKLKADGLITQEEYDKLKSQILAR